MDDVPNTKMLDPGHETRFHQSEEIAALRQALMRLPPEKRELIIDLTGNFCTSRIERLEAERNPGYAKESVYARADRAEAATD
jgi:hypothetical protein